MDKNCFADHAKQLPGNGPRGRLLGRSSEQIGFVQIFLRQPSDQVAFGGLVAGYFHSVPSSSDQFQTVLAQFRLDFIQIAADRRNRRIQLVGQREEFDGLGFLKQPAYDEHFAFLGRIGCGFGTAELLFKPGHVLVISLNRYADAGFFNQRQLMLREEKLERQHLAMNGPCADLDLFRDLAGCNFPLPVQQHFQYATLSIGDDHGRQSFLRETDVATTVDSSALRPRLGL
nr:hypothetical protein [Paenibacillus cisolokensis]